LKRIIALTLAGLSLTIGLATAAHATPGRTTNRSPPVPASVRNAESALTSELAKLHVKPHTRLTPRQLKGLGLKPDPSWLAARFKQLAHSTRARAADAGATYWFTYQYDGHFWADVYYTGPYRNSKGYTNYTVYSNYKICDWQGYNCIDLNVYTSTINISQDGTNYYYQGPGGYMSDPWGMPEYGYGPFTG
jgi:hypothetical protein